MELRKGIIVRSQKYQENSKIITIINEEAMSTFLVRGSSSMNSKNFSYSNELTKIAYDFHQKRVDSFSILTQGKIMNSYANIKADFNKLNDAIIIIEASYQLGNHIEDFQTFYQFLDQILELLNDNQYNAYYAIIFRLKLLYLLGIGPIFSKCVNCGSREELVGFDFLDGGMKCKNCSDHGYFQSDVISILKFLYLTKLEFLTSEVLSKIPNYLDDANNFLNQYYEHYLGYKSIAQKVINKLKSN